MQTLRERQAGGLPDVVGRASRSCPMLKDGYGLMHRYRIQRDAESGLVRGVYPSLEIVRVLEAVCLRCTLQIAKVV